MITNGYFLNRKYYISTYGIDKIFKYLIKSQIKLQNLY